MRIVAIIAVLTLTAPAWTDQSSGVTARLRGVSAVSDRVAWASGSGGTVLRTSDGGAQWSMNKLLASLPADEYQRVSSELTWRPLKVRQVLHKHGEPLAEVVPSGNGTDADAGDYLQD